MAADLCDANFYVNAADMIREAICARAALREAGVSHASEVMGHLDDETPENKASENDGGRSGGHPTIAGKSNETGSRCPTVMKEGAMKYQRVTKGVSHD
jgi:hypothetical protein